MEFRHTLNARVEQYLVCAGKSRVAGLGIFLKALFYGAVTIGAYVALLTNMAGSWGSLLLALTYGLSCLMLAMNASHDAAHSALTGNRRLDSCLHRVSFGLVGVDGRLWQMRHIGSHHLFPNVNGCDIDIDENPFLRLSPNHAWKPRYRHQHLYAPFVYMLTLVHSITTSDFIYLRKKRLANMHDISHPLSEVALFAFGKMLYVAINIALPFSYIALPWWQIALGYVITTSAMSVVFVFLLIGTHFSAEAEFPQPDAQGRINLGWARHALETSVDWLPESRLAQFISGGANAHAAHHLFPRLSHRHYIPITRIIRATAHEFGLCYHQTTFTGMVKQHFRHLRHLGRNELVHG